MFRLVNAGFLAILMMWATLSQASWEEARDLVEGATKEMVVLLADPALKGDAAFDQLFAGVDGVLKPVVDFPRISRSVMAKYYRQANDDQRQRFEHVFKDTLVKTYTKILAVFNFDRYEIVPNRQESPKPTRQTVHVDVFDAEGKKYTLIYYVLKDEQGWKVTNVHLDGINLRQIFKNQFADAMSSEQNIDKVIDDWDRMVDNNPQAKGTESKASSGADSESGAES